MAILKRNLTFVICLAALILTTISCKKEQELSAGATSILLLPTVENGIDGQEYEYTLKAMIVSPQKVEMKQHGFKIVPSGGAAGETEYVPLGDAEKVGSFSGDFKSMLPLEMLDITAYIVLPSGDTLSSKGKLDTTPTPTPPTGPYPVAIAPSGHNGSIGNGEVFVSDIFNFDSLNYTVIEYGIDYNLMATFDTKNPSYEDRYIAWTGNDGAYQIRVEVDIYPSDTYFTPDTDYAYRVYAIARENATSIETTVYAYDNSFHSRMMK